MMRRSKRVLVAGATGYLGRHLLRAFSDAGNSVRALARSPDKLIGLEPWVDEVFVGEATDPSTLTGLCEGLDIVVSALGITRQSDGLTYDDVDYWANRHLLDAALEAGVGHFTYIHLLHAEAMVGIAMAEAKAKFAAELQSEAIASTILCPSGFFSDLSEILGMAQRGRVFLFGNGSAHLSPIHGADLARLCVRATRDKVKHLDVGGPQTFSQNEIAELAFEAIGKPVRVTHVPLWLARFGLLMARVTGQSANLGALEFFLKASTMDMSAPAHGAIGLVEDFELQLSKQYEVS